MKIQSQEDVEAMVDTHRGNGADMRELYADFQLSHLPQAPTKISLHCSQPRHSNNLNTVHHPSTTEAASLSMGRHSCAAAFDLNIQPYDNRHGFSGHTTFESDPTLTLGHEGYSSPEEPIQDLGPDGSEIGLFTTPVDANTDVDSDSTTNEDNAEQDQPRTSTWEKHHASTSRGHRPYEPPPHMYNMDMWAFDVPEFSEMPNLGFNASYIGVSLRAGVQKDLACQGQGSQEIAWDWGASYNELSGWTNIMQKYNPDTITVLETLPYYKNNRAVVDVRQFHMLFWTFPQCIHAFKNYKPIIQIDDTFLFGRYKHVLLLAVIQDGNQKTIPIAFALVPREDTNSYKFFLKKIYDNIFFRNNTIWLISDRGSSILFAIESLGSRFRSRKVEHRYYLRHLASNYHGRYKKDSERKLILRMRYELLPNKFEEMLHELDEKE
ncbi:hypothetical protein GQ457_15G022560 [Hibiscus cannabinus]